MLQSASRLLTALTAALLFYAVPVYAQGDPPIFPDLTGQTLREALIDAYKPTSVFGYDRARDSMFAVVYFEPDETGSTGTVRGVYTDFPITIDRASSTAPRTQAFQQGVNTEHTWPQSLGAGSGNARSDLHHLFPTRADANSSRGNRPFADIPFEQVARWWYLDQSPTTPPPAPYAIWSKTSTAALNSFEPREDHKGRTARAMVYFYTMYQEQASTPFWELQQETFLAWHRAHPADSTERARSFVIAQWQEHPNPYVLDSSLVRRAWFEGPSDPDPEPMLAFVGRYTFDGTTSCDDEDLTVEQQPDFATFAPFARVGVLCNQGAGAFNSRAWPTGTLDEGAFVTFSVSAEPGWLLAFSEGDALSFVSRRSSTGPTQGAVRIQGDTGPMVQLASFAASTSDATTTVPIPTERGFETVTLRIYAWNASSAAGTLRFDDVRFSGYTIPAEPVVTAPEDGGTLVVQGDEEDPVTVAWTPVAPGAEVVYQWTASVNDPLLDVPDFVLERSVAEVTLTMEDLRDALVGAGIAVGESGTLYHRVAARVDTVETTGPIAQLTLVRQPLTRTETAPHERALVIESIYPNPARSAPTLVLTAPGDVTVEVFDVLGRSLGEARLAAAGRTELPLAEVVTQPLAAGTYFVRVLADGTTPAQSRLVILP